jgi:hypothetical protein
LGLKDYAFCVQPFCYQESGAAAGKVRNDYFPRSGNVTKLKEISNFEAFTEVMFSRRGLLRCNAV